ncbi:hypothetical protein KBX08_12630 [Micromonospora sp. H61]|uniref:hypothetical protein n=1 Tax=Micromonospora sp. H61 TaxID=2824888 RepID=UPI001B36EFCD|nr:hypothetical protein [Micromonospora sp. H61]MBQ0990931.1 hypothetical protein [Micromonospora sp. H61]
MAVQMLLRARRIGPLLVAGVLALTGLSACTPTIKGITGVGVDADRQPVAVLSWCADRPPDVVTFFTQRASISPSPSTVATSTGWPYWPGRRYAVPRAATSPTTVRLEGFPPDPTPGRHVAFRLFGVASDNSFTSHSVTFRLAELEDMQPGSVLITDIVDNGEVQRSVSVDEFASLGQNAC